MKMVGAFPAQVLGGQRTPGPLRQINPRFITRPRLTREDPLFVASSLPDGRRPWARRGLRCLKPPAPLTIMPSESVRAELARIIDGDAESAKR